MSNKVALSCTRIVTEHTAELTLFNLRERITKREEREERGDTKRGGYYERRVLREKSTKREGTKREEREERGVLRQGGGTNRGGNYCRGTWALGLVILNKVDRW